MRVSLLALEWDAHKTQTPVGRSSILIIIEFVLSVTELWSGTWAMCFCIGAPTASNNTLVIMREARRAPTFVCIYGTSKIENNADEREGVQGKEPFERITQQEQLHKWTEPRLQE